VRITLDNNCLISLEKKENGYQDIKALIDWHPAKITLCIPAIAASENQKGGTVHPTFTQFQEFLREIGCGNCELLNPMLYLDICYLNHAVFVGGEMASIEQSIHEILFPQIPFLYADYRKTFLSSPGTLVDRRWRNAKCDVQAMWCHIHYKGDVFVSTDDNFHKLTKKPRLIALGASQIMYPKECREEMSSVPI
jgi:hypothetical protein